MLIFYKTCWLKQLILNLKKNVLDCYQCYMKVIFYIIVNNLMGNVGNQVNDALILHYVINVK